MYKSQLYLFLQGKGRIGNEIHHEEIEAANERCLRNDAISLRIFPSGSPNHPSNSNYPSVTHMFLIIFHTITELKQPPKHKPERKKEYNHNCD